MKLYTLPRSVQVGGREYPIHADFREAVQILTYLGREELAPYLRWQVALGLFYDQVPQDTASAARAMVAFLCCGQQETPGVKLLDWELDAGVILAEVNKVAGREVREAPFLHWWTFLGWFHAIGQGPLSTLVTVRSKLRRGQKLLDWEQQFYRDNRSRVDMKAPLSPQEQAQKQQLLRLLDGGGNEV